MRVSTSANTCCPARAYSPWAMFRLVTRGRERRADVAVLEVELGAVQRRLRRRDAGVDVAELGEQLALAVELAPGALHGGVGGARLHASPRRSGRG